MNIRDFSEQELRDAIEDSITYLTEVDDVVEEVTIEESFRNRSGDQLLLSFDGAFWNVSHGFNLEESFGTREDAEEYLAAEGFKKEK